MTIYSHIEKLISDQKPFVLYRKPNASQVTVIQQNDNELRLIEDSETNIKGFVFTDFWNKRKVLFEKNNIEIRYHDYEIKEEDTLDILFDDNYEENVKNSHIALVKKGVEDIKAKGIEKVVLSREERISIPHKDRKEYYVSLLNKYLNAFCYWWFHPKVGEWMGATPEQLLKKDFSALETVSLAGTQVFEDNFIEVVWGDKEKIEQQIVTDFIKNQLQPFSKTLLVTEPYTFRAGNVVHIKADIRADLRLESDFIKVVNTLHPTPALCGFPKKEAQKFIFEHENYRRTFYGGYLGEWELEEGKADLFVNLRCMEFHSDSSASLFVGGGITSDSDPLSEWKETVHKSKTLKTIIYQNANSK